MSKEGQRQRIYKALKTGDRISMVSLHRVGAASPRGFCGCLTKESRKSARFKNPRLFQLASVRSVASRKPCVQRVSTSRCELGLSKVHLKLDPRIYSQLIRDNSLSHGAFRLWHLFRDMTGNNPNCWPSQRYIAKTLKCGVNSVKRWSGELEAAGYLSVELGNEHTPNRYYLCVSMADTQTVTKSNSVATMDRGVSTVDVLRVSAMASELNSVEPTPIIKNNGYSADELREMGLRHIQAYKKGIL